LEQRTQISFAVGLQRESAVTDAYVVLAGPGIDSLLLIGLTLMTSHADMAVCNSN
jgi:hypothetical protein